MAKYIEKQALMDKMHDAYEARNPVQNAIMDEATMIVFHQPPADVRPVRRGRWVVFDNEGWEDIKCSICSESPYWHPTEYAIRPYFCPNCGADMRGGDAE